MYRAASRFIQRRREGFTSIATLTGRPQRKRAKAQADHVRATTLTTQRPVARRHSTRPAGPPHVNETLPPTAAPPVPVRFFSPGGHVRTRTVRITTLERVAVLLGSRQPQTLREAQAYLVQLFFADAHFAILEEEQLVTVLARVPHRQRWDLAALRQSATRLRASTA